MECTCRLDFSWISLNWIWILIHSQVYLRLDSEGSRNGDSGNNVAELPAESLLVLNIDNLVSESLLV
jgi:hypothetical protein